MTLDSQMTIITSLQLNHTASFTITITTTGYIDGGGQTHLTIT